MKTQTRQAQAPAAPAMRLLRTGTADKRGTPRRIGWYIMPLMGIASRPDREQTLRNYFNAINV